MQKIMNNKIVNFLDGYYNNSVSRELSEQYNTLNCEYIPYVLNNTDNRYNYFTKKEIIEFDEKKEYLYDWYNYSDYLKNHYKNTLDENGFYYYNKRYNSLYNGILNQKMPFFSVFNKGALILFAHAGSLFQVIENITENSTHLLKHLMHFCVKKGENLINENAKLVIDENFAFNDELKSVYSKFSKELFPYLIQENVDIIVTSSIDKKCFNNTLVLPTFTTIEERTEYLRNINKLMF